MASWPEAWGALVSELRSGRGQPALVVPNEGSEALLATLGPFVDERISVGERFSESGSAGAALSAIQPTASSALLLDIEVLFSPQLHLDVVPFVRQLSQGRALVVAWPGQVAGGRVSYSLPGRADYLDQRASGLVVLRPVEVDFPDEVPYTVERYPA